jgi:signal transduction histidine kinase
MPQIEHARVFERFYRAGARGDEGFGLGLAIVHEIMRVLDGAVEIESEPGIGTSVRLVLPAAVA